MLGIEDREWLPFLSGIGVGGVLGVMGGFVLAAICLRLAMLRVLARIRELFQRTCEVAEKAAYHASTAEAKIEPRRSMWD